MAITLVSQTLRSVTPELIKEWLKLPPWTTDRVLRECRIQEHLKAIRGGTFHGPEWAMAIWEDQEFRINGQHTSTLFDRLLKEHRKFFDKVDWKICVKRFKCDTLEDIAMLFAQFDKRSSTRSNPEINSGYAATNENLKSLPLAIVNLCVSGISYRAWRKELRKHPQEERASLLGDNVSFCQWVHDTLSSGKSTQYLRRQGVVAAMYGSWKKSQSDAKLFWGEVRDGTNPNPKSPSRALQQLLMMTSVNHGSGSRTGKRTDSALALYVKCIQGWNGSRTGKPFRFFYSTGMNVPNFA